MAKDALIKLRCSADLKRRITALAERRDQSVSDYIRSRLIDTTPELRIYTQLDDTTAEAAEDPQAPTPPAPHTKDQAEEAARILKFAKRKARTPRSPKPPAPKTTGA